MNWIFDEDTMSRFDALLNRPEPTDGPSPHALRRLAAGDLPAAEAAEVRAAVQAAPALAERLTALEAEDRAFLKARPFADVKDELFRRAESLPPPRSAGLFGAVLRPRSLVWAIAAVVTALLIGMFAPLAGQGGDPLVMTPTGPNRLKGAETLSAWQPTGDAPARVESGVLLREGDVLQFTVTTTRSHLALLGVDGTGTVSRYLPVGGDLSMPFAPGSNRPLPDALTLDDAPGPEVFLAFLSDEPLLVEELERAVHDALEKAGTAALAEGEWFDELGDVDVGSFVARKEGGSP